MHSIKSTLNKTLEKLGSGNRIRSGLACIFWPDIVGEKISKNTKASSVNNGILFVITASSSWANQLNFFKREFIKKLNKKIGAKTIKDIRFQVGYIESLDKTSHHKNDIDLDQIELKDDDKEEIAYIISSIQDNQLKKVFSNLYEKNFKYKKWKKQQGHNNCKICSAITDSSDSICIICSQRFEDSRMNKIKDMLDDEPWLSHHEIEQFIPNLSKDEFNKACRDLIGDYEKKFEEKSLEYLLNSSKEVYNVIKNFAYQITFLKTHKSPDAIDKIDIKNAIGNDKFKILYNARTTSKEKERL